MSKMAKTIAVLGVVAGLGAAAMPLSSFAVDPVSRGVTITAEVGETISLAIDNVESDATVSMDTLVPGGALQSKSVVAKVTTNGANGYTLSMAANGEVAANKTAMAWVKSDDTVDEATVINTLGASETAASAANSWWGFMISGDATYGDWTGIPASATTIKETNGPAASGDETTITFGAQAKAGLKSGTYRGKVTLTATVK